MTARGGAMETEQEGNCKRGTEKRRESVRLLEEH